MDISYIDTTITRPKHFAYISQRTLAPFFIPPLRYFSPSRPLSSSALPGICGTDRPLAGFLLRHIPAPSGPRLCSPSTSTPGRCFGILGAISISLIRHPGPRSGLHHFAIDGHDDLAQRVSKIL
ncbi:hypothetical protein B0H15DRAFT_950366 [Mycena belliarum]|uniref:Uncharacterized protein n=1 Tax=Mycena belliarum TaxID=1033014 RepID=A0AAD6U5Z7_9AGAR|nr:hypothetical protein B0H15DRAFT_950366 [Mycena belliae]